MQLDGTPLPRPAGRPRLPRVDCVCVTCGKPFQTKRSEVARGGGRFCEPACYRRSQIGPKSPLADRVWSKIDKNGPIPGHCPERGPCWEWTAAVGVKHQYGIINVGGKSKLAHRVVWEMVVGPIPEGMDVLHHCDNRRCVKADPDPALSHLYLGNDLENSHDAWSRGRAVKPPQPSPEQYPRGEKHGNAKLTDAIVTEIHRLRAEGWSQTRIAVHVGVHQTHVSRVLLGKAWGHVTDAT
jgi:predicted XRE-type DNA-binding protein